MKKKGRLKRGEKHKKILEDYENVKKNHLERLATILIKRDEINQKLKEKNIKDNFLKKF